MGGSSSEERNIGADPVLACQAQSKAVALRNGKGCWTWRQASFGTTTTNTAAETQPTILTVVHEDSILHIARVESPLHFEGQGPVTNLCGQEDPVLRTLIDDRRPGDKSVCVRDIPCLETTSSCAEQGNCFTL